MAATTHMVRAAQLAALRVEALLLEMLAAGETGDVRVEVGYGSLQPIKRTEDKGSVIKIARGQLQPLEQVEA